MENDISRTLSVQDDNSCLVRIQVKIPGNLSGATRATGFSDTHIQTIDVLSFREDNSTFQYRATAVAIDEVGEWFDIVLNKSRDEVQTLIILANLKEEIDNLNLVEGTTTIADIRKDLTIHFVHQTVYDPTHTTNVTGQFGEDRPLPMWGESEPVAILTDEMSLGTIYMLRSLAAVTVLVNLDMDNPEQKPFQLVDVVITNTPDKGLVIPDPALLNTASDGYITATQPNLGTLTPTYTNAYYTSTDGVSITHGIYIGERNNTVGIAEEDRTWLLIGGIYDNSGVVTWYRLPWIDREGKQWDVLRNHNYIFNITRVTGAGNTEEEAKDTEIYADVIPWNLGTDVVFDIEDIYWIWIDPTFASYDVQGGTGTVSIETNYPDSWTATVSGSETERDVPCTWLTIDPASTGSQLKYNVSQSSEWEVRTGYLHIQAGGFAVTVRINQSSLYIESKTVSPTGNIDTQGESRTVSFTGLFDDIQVRAWDVTNNQEIVQSPANPKAPGNITTGNPSSVTVSIPAWGSDVNRTIRIQYYDKVQQDWVTIQEATQNGYNFTVGSNLTNGSTINTSNQSYNITVSGTSWPTLYARAVIQGTQNVVGGPITINPGTTSGSITIGTYEQWENPSFNRTVELQWSRSNTDWSGATTLNHGTQSGSFKVTSSKVEVPIVKAYDSQLRLIPLLGTTLEVTVDGTYKGGWVEVRAVVSGTETPVSTGTITITNTTTRKENVPVSRNTSYSTTMSKYSNVKDYAGHREVQCQYRRYIPSSTGGTGAWESTWTNVDAAIEQLGYVTLKATGRVVAGEDCPTTGTTSQGDKGMTWAEAMGIPASYNYADYPQAEIVFGTLMNLKDLTEQKRAPTLNYTTGYSAANGGCAAYTENGTTNSFYLPTWEEMKEMTSRYSELGEIAYEESYYYWMNIQVSVINTSGVVHKEPAKDTLRADLEYSQSICGKDNNGGVKNRARCVRGK